LTVHLRALSPLAVLERGFAIVRRDGREIVTRVQQVQTGDRLQVRVSDGQFGALVGDNGRGKRRSKADDSPQLSLGL
jgi:exonuclease VII large subunit